MTHDQLRQDVETLRGCYKSLPGWTYFRELADRLEAHLKDCESGEKDYSFGEACAIMREFEGQTWLRMSGPPRAYKYSEGKFWWEYDGRWRVSETWITEEQQARWRPLTPERPERPEPEKADPCVHCKGTGRFYPSGEGLSVLCHCQQEPEKPEETKWEECSWHCATAMRTLEGITDVSDYYYNGIEYIRVDGCGSGAVGIDILTRIGCVPLRRKPAEPPKGVEITGKVKRDSQHYVCAEARFPEEWIGKEVVIRLVEVTE